MLDFVMKSNWDFFQILQFFYDTLAVNAEFFLQDCQFGPQSGICIMDELTDMVQNDYGLVFFINYIEQLFFLLTSLQQIIGLGIGKVF